jgi:hypothetical protein
MPRGSASPGGTITTTWYRQAFTTHDVGPTTWLLATLSVGQTLKRIRFTWSGTTVVDSYSDLVSLIGAPILVGIVTTIGDGLEPVPDPAFEAGDANPPAERWLWYEGRAMYPTAYSQSDTGTNIVTTVPASEPGDVRAMVRAPAMDAGDFLHVWVSTSADFSWPSAIRWYVNGTASVLVET